MSSNFKLIIIFTMSTTVSRSSPSPRLHFHKCSISLNASSWIRILHVPFYGETRCVSALKTASSDGGRAIGNQDSYAPSMLRKPVLISQPEDDNDDEDGDGDGDGNEKERDGSNEDWVDWEDKILEETVPLVSFVRMILHSGKYNNGDRLTPEHQRTILERLLPYHPAYETKIGSGVDSIMVGHHPEFKGTRCMFIVRKNGEFIDFSYWKCIKGLIRTKYPLFADTFILRHFRRRRRTPKLPNVIILTRLIKLVRPFFRLTNHQMQLESL